MKSWMKSPPEKPPEPPPHVVLEVLMSQAQQLEQAGQPDQALTYIRTNGPRMQVDRWGQPLPLSQGEQDRLDGLVDLLMAPMQRMRDRIRSGTLTASERDAVKAVFPIAYAHLIDETTRELVREGPPIEAWAEVTLSVLFDAPASKVYDRAPSQAESGQGQSSGEVPGGGGTPAERRELAVREEHP